MNVPEKLLEVLKQDGVVAIATLGSEGPHLVNTWNRYVQVADGERLLIPAGFMRRTEAAVAENAEVLVTLGSSLVQGRNGPGTGFLVKGKASFVNWATGGHHALRARPEGRGRADQGWARRSWSAARADSVAASVAVATAAAWARRASATPRSAAS